MPDEIKQLVEALNLKKKEDHDDWKYTVMQEISRISDNEKLLLVRMERVEGKVSANYDFISALKIKEETVKSLKENGFAWLKVLVSAGGLVAVVEGIKTWLS